MYNYANENRYENRHKQEVYFASKSDLAGMLEVLKANLISNKKIHHLNKNKIEASGFLIGPFTADEIVTHLEENQNPIILTVKEEERVVGYLISYALNQVNEKLYQEFTDFPEINNIEDKSKILYYRQIAKLPGKENIGTKLIEKMLSEAKKLGYKMIVCRIVHEPFCNKISIGFHAKFGFKLLGEVQNNNNIKLGIYFNKL